VHRVSNALENDSFDLERLSPPDEIILRSTHQFAALACLTAQTGVEGHASHGWRHVPSR
jgi:hypothetical protein